MKKITKMLTFACAVLATSTLGAAVGLQTAKAEVDAGFEFVGGSVRLVDPTGIRFTFGIADTYADVAQYEIGTLIIPQETLGTKTLNHNDDTTDSETVAYREIVCTGKWATDYIESAVAGKEYFNAALTEIPETDYATRIYARAYVKVNGTYYYSEIAERSLSEVASKAIVEGYTYDVLYDYVDTGLTNKNASVTVEEATVGIGQEYQLALSGNWNCAAVWSVANEEVATIDKYGVVTGVTEGKTTVTAKIGSTEYTAPLTVGARIEEIKPLDLELGVDSNNKENTSLALSAATFGLASGVTVTSVTDITDGEKALTVSDGVVSGVSSGEYTWLVGNSAGYYQKVNVTLATLIISNATELTQMTAILNASVKESETHTDGTYTYQKYYGYFVMDAEVDYGGNAFVSAVGCRDTNVENGFMGTFDGRGYTISNIKFNRANVTVGSTTNKHVTTGLFGALGSTGVVKNLNLTGVNLANTWATVIGIATFGKVENLNIEITNMAANASGVSMYAYTMWVDSTGATHHGGAELRDTVIELNTGGTVTLGTDGGATFFFSISGDAADYQGKFTNNYYIANGKLSAANTWVQNATQSGRFEATGNNNYLINNFEIKDDAIELCSVEIPDVANTYELDLELTGNDLAKSLPITYIVTDEEGNVSNLVYVENGIVKISENATSGTAYISAKLGDVLESNKISVTVTETATVEIEPLDLELGVDSNNKENTSLALSAETFGLASGVAVTSVTDITDGEKALTVTDGVVSGVSSGEYTWLVGNSAGYYQKVNVTLATLIISDAEELTQMTAILNASVKESETHTDGTYTYQKYYGYFVMDADVDYGGNAFVSAMGCRDTNVENGFMGTFDGRGYTISNIKFNRANVTVGNTTNKHVTTGLFGALGSTGVVKNLNLTGVNLANTWATVIGIATFGKVENLNIEITNMASNASGISMYAYTMWRDSTGSTHHGGAELRDTVIELNTSATVTLGTDGGATFFFSISGDAADYQGKFTNNYYIANGKLSSANTWVQNATQSGRFEATGNNNYMFNNATVLTATSYTKGSENCEVSTGTTISTAIVMIDNVRVSATVSNGVITLSAEALDKLSVGAHTLTVLSGETYLEGTFTVA